MNVLDQGLEQDDADDIVAGKFLEHFYLSPPLRCLMSPVRRLTLLLGLSVCLLTTNSLPAAEWSALLQNSPKGANSVALVDMAALRNYANRLKRGRQKPVNLKELDQLLTDLPPNIDRSAVVAWLDFDSLEPIWEFTTVGFEKGKAPTVRSLYEHEQGYQDIVLGQPVVWSPRGRYLMPYGEDKVAVLRPADRPLFARWLRKSKTKRDEMSSFLETSVTRATDRSALMLAVDLGDAISGTQASERTASLKSVSNAGLQASVVGTLFSQLRGVSLDVQIHDRLQGKLVLEFETSPTILREAGKDIVLEILARRGLMLPELKTWGHSIERDKLVLTGPMEVSSLIDLLSFLTTTPSSIGDSRTQSASTSQSASPSLTTGNTSQANPQAIASKRYFDSVNHIITECRTQKGMSVPERGCYVDKLSRKIDQLPMLNVDPDLLDYGGKASQLLRDSGITIRGAYMQAAKEKLPSYTSYVNYGNGYWGSGSFAVNDNRHHNSMADVGAKTQGMTQHFTNLQTIDNMTLEIRRAMTTKYKIEF